jgi:hypothetical protein
LSYINYKGQAIYFVMGYLTGLPGRVFGKSDILLTGTLKRPARDPKDREFV